MSSINVLKHLRAAPCACILHHESDDRSSYSLRLFPGSPRSPRSPTSSGWSAYGRPASIFRCAKLLMISSTEPPKVSKPTKLCLYSLGYRRGQDLLWSCSGTTGLFYSCLSIDYLSDGGLIIKAKALRSPSSDQSSILLLQRSEIGTITIRPRGSN